MNVTEVIYADSSTSTFYGNGGASHEGDLAIARLQLITAKHALEIYLKYDGKFQLTRDGHRLAVVNVIEPMSGETFTTPSGKVTKKSCREALEWCKDMIYAIEHGAVVLEED